jgi:hypothetical protein
LIGFDRPADGRPWCIAVSFRPSDAGFSALFSDTLTTPSPYQVDDARVGLCTLDLEQVDGSLDSAAPRVEAMSGTIGFETVIQGIPLSWSGVGEMTVMGTRYSFRTREGGEGLVDPCRGP